MAREFEAKRTQSRRLAGGDGSRVDGLAPCVRERALDEAIRALDARRAEWHGLPPEECNVSVEAAARIAVEASLPGVEEELRALGVRHEYQLIDLREQVRLLRRDVGHLLAVADAAEQALTWDYVLYDETPDEHWLAIDRSDWARVFNALASLDRWSPWRTQFEHRLRGL